jgi:hypothetical protein
MTPGELLNIILTPGNTDDRTPVPSLLQQLFGKVFAGKGYRVAKIGKTIVQNRRHSTNHQAQGQHETALDAPQRPVDARACAPDIETIIDQLKNIS